MRLIVEAVSAEDQSQFKKDLRLLVSVSRADTGESVSGLAKANFRCANAFPLDMEVREAYELLWDPVDKEPSGVYFLLLSLRNNDVTFTSTDDQGVTSPYHITFQPKDWNTNWWWNLGLQVRLFGVDADGQKILGQTVIRVLKKP
ncbi:hypothetical protein [Pseudomonas sp. 210_17 TE3656]